MKSRCAGIESHRRCHARGGRKTRPVGSARGSLGGAVLRGDPSDLAAHVVPLSLFMRAPPTALAFRPPRSATAVAITIPALMRSARIENHRARHHTSLRRPDFLRNDVDARLRPSEAQASDRRRDDTDVHVCRRGPGGGGGWRSAHKEREWHDGRREVGRIPTKNRAFERSSRGATRLLRPAHGNPPPRGAGHGARVFARALRSASRASWRGSSF